MKNRETSNFLKIKPREPLKKIINFLKIIEKSFKKSKLNYFFQMLNFCLIIILLLVMVPDLIESLLSKWEGIKIFYSYFPKIGFSIIVYFISWVISSIFNFSWSTLFQTPFKFTIGIFTSFLILLFLIYYKLVISIYIKIKKDINYLFYDSTK